MPGRGDTFLLVCLLLLCAGLVYLDWLRQGELVLLNERLNRLEQPTVPKPARARKPRTVSRENATEGAKS